MADTFITLAGNLTADPELSQTEAGVAFATFSLAVTPRIRNGEGAWADAPTTFHRCVIWRDQTTHAAKSLHKGDRALVVGSLRTRSYVTPDGEHRNTSEVSVDECGPSLRWATAEVTKPSRANEETATDQSAPMASLPRRRPARKGAA